MVEDNNTPSCPFPSCGCVGYGYVPNQTLSSTFTVPESLDKGTLFPELSLTIDEYGKVCKKVGGSVV